METYYNKFKLVTFQVREYSCHESTYYEDQKKS